MRKILKKNSIKPFKVFDENNLNSLPRIILSSVLVILFFYSLPIVINFTNNKIESSAGIQNNSKAILAYTLNKKSSNSSNSQTLNEDDLLIDIIPKDRRRPYSVRKIIRSIIDKNDDQSTFFEIGKKYGPSLVTGLGRLNGQSVGVIANDCMFYAGAMTTSASKKLERFSDFCNSFHIPIISLVDEPGFMIGPESEKSGTIRFGTAAISAIMQSRVPWASVHMHKSFGVAATAHYGPDSFTLLWPSALSGALPVEGGVAVAFSKEIAKAKNPEKKQKELEDQLAQRQSPIPRAEGFSAHDLIDPRETRPRLISWLELALKAYRLKSPKPYLVTMRP